MTIYLPERAILTKIIFSRLKDASIGFGIRQTSARNADRIAPFPKNFRLFQTFRRNNRCWHFSKKASFLPASTFRAEKHRQTAATTIVWRSVTKRIEQIRKIPPQRSITLSKYGSKIHPYFCWYW